MPNQKLGRHIFQATAVDVFHPNAGNGSENAKVDHLEFYAFDIQIAAFIINWRLVDHDILKFHISVDYLTVVAVVNCIQELNEKLICLSLRKNTQFLFLPKVVEFAALEVLHHDDELLLFGQGKVVIQFDDVFVSQGPQRLYLLGYHMRSLTALKIENFDRNLLVQEAVVGQKNGSKTTFAELAFHFYKLHSDLMVKVLTYTKFTDNKTFCALMGNWSDSNQDIILVKELTEGVEQVLMAMDRLHMIAVH